MFSAKKAFALAEANNNFKETLTKIGLAIESCAREGKYSLWYSDRFVELYHEELKSKLREGGYYARVADTSPIKIYISWRKSK